MNDILALSSLGSLTGSSVSQTDVTETSGALFGELLTNMLAQSVLQQDSDQADGTSGLLSGLASGTDTDSTVLLLCMMMLGSSESGAGMTAALSSLLSAGQTDTLTTANLRAAASAYGSTSTAVQTSTGSAGDIPYEAWKPVNPSVTSVQGARSAANYRTVIDQFHVETNGRYEVNKQGTGDTYCNIFVWDVTRAMGAEIPHYVDAQTNQPRSYPDTDGAVCMTANTMGDWLSTTGQAYGWKRVSAAEAQTYANRGCPAVATWKNSGGHGHVQVVCPSENGTYDPQKGVTIAQAGRHLYDYAYITQVYSGRTLDDVAYYVHV